MKEINFPQTTKWIVAYDDSFSKYCPRVVTPIDCFITGLPFLDVFDTREAAISAFPSLSAHFTE